MADRFKNLQELLDKRRMNKTQRNGLGRMKNDLAFRRKVLEELANRLEKRGRKGDAEAAGKIRDMLDEIDWKKVFDLVIKYLPIVLSILMAFI